eukprot:GILJ01002488.1.p1 GENE.GILJ01002488.1~~GILJ01002488.1.p1  ORF type:complete len:365 (-),score=51.72 GILJ01002488.1:87-1181(-)
MGACLSSNNGPARRQRRLTVTHGNGTSAKSPTSQGTSAYPDPERLTRHSFSLGQVPLWCSTCILPGFDPKELMEKECQDDCVFVSQFGSDGKSAYCAVFDGHGKNGRLASNFAVENCHKYIQKSTHYGTDMLKAICEALKKTDTEMKRSGIDVSFSGTTAVLAIMDHTELIVASVGDSRAILAQQTADNGLIATPLTIDQKPENPKERQRVIASGGRVEQMQDENGIPIGPFRVWVMDAAYPGIAMSRSLGDTVAHHVGVIAEPITLRKKVDFDAFKFIVLGSDGIWDVMTNDEVIQFVDEHRHSASRSDEGSHVAQLLCEEARKRWLVLAAEEDAIVDDISCVVMEFHVAMVPSAIHCEVEDA